jgi:hypothetical protein
MMRIIIKIIEFPSFRAFFLFMIPSFFTTQGHPIKEKPICSENLQKERRGGKIPDTSATDHG